MTSSGKLFHFDVELYRGEGVKICTFFLANGCVRVMDLLSTLDSLNEITFDGK